MSSTATCGNHSGAKPNTIPGQAKSVRLPPGILFAFNPESCSGSARNAVRLHPGTPFAFARNPQHTAPHRLGRMMSFLFIWQTVLLIALPNSLQRRDAQWNTKPEIVSRLATPA
jgi:hypothetical protein